jgi:hypothetical protein
MYANNFNGMPNSIQFGKPGYKTRNYKKNAI